MYDVAILVGSAVRDSNGRQGRLIAADQARVRLEMFDVSDRREEVSVPRGNSSLDTSYEILTTGGWKALGALVGKEDSIHRLMDELNADMLGEAPGVNDPHKRQKVNDDGPRGGLNIKKKTPRWSCNCTHGKDPVVCQCQSGKRKREVTIPLSYKNSYNPEYRAWKGLSKKEKKAATALSKKATAKLGLGKVTPMQAHDHGTKLIKALAKKAGKAEKGSGKKKISVLKASKAKAAAKRGKGKAA